ncbi:CHAT domain-containing tetratricopeptide repeat protein [Limnoraphis robusta]|uniref:CHAT domain-containing tetratricopeptide repeat protein n=1 Tax=Limnoraphis robusta TaxID=1118279 RepID=UPI00066BB33C|nr:CHAT domain-containing tetratricopeptide repeat protein [Limnoraphis robusta]
MSFLKPYYWILAVLTLVLVCTTNARAVFPGSPILSKVEPIAQIETQEDPKTRAMELYKEGTQLLNSGQFKAALETFEQVLITVRSINARLGEAGTLNQIALVYYHLGEYEKALTSYEEALNIYTQEKNLQEQGTIFTNMGVLYGELGQYQKALESHQQALALAQKVDDTKKQGEILNNMGTIYQKLNQNKEALQFYLQALEILRKDGDPGWQATILNNTGLIYAELEQYQEAIDSYTKALTLAEKDGDHITKGRILNNLGLVRSKLGDWQGALQSLEKALIIRKKLIDLPGERTTHNDIGSVYRDLGEYEIALKHYEQALEISRKIHARPQEGETLSNIGLTLLKSGQEAPASQKLFEAVTIWESLHPGLNDENKVSLMDSQADTYRWLQRALIAQNQIEAALEVSERGRARAFAQLLASRFNESDLSPPPLTFKQIQEIARQQKSTLVEYSIVIEDELLYIWVIQPNGKVEFRTVDISSLRSFLPLVGSDRDLAMNRGNKGAEKEEMSINNIRQTYPLIENEPLENPEKVPNPVRRRDPFLSRRYRFLIEPIADLLPTNPETHVIFIPHQKFFLVPFAALQDEEGKYLIEKHTILISPSIQVLDITAKHQNTLSQKEPLNTLIVGNPTMPSIAYRLGEESKPLSSLPGTEREALTIAKLLKTEALIGDLATEKTVVKNMIQANNIHLATHGLVNELKHLGLEIPGALALTPSLEEDGLLTAHEILDLKLKAELVVLSACNTGLGKITEDGVIGLSRSFISAGVPSVIVSLWYIPDHPSADLMIEFYQQMQTISDKALALRKAMIKTIEKHPRPLEWAGFILIGQSGF